MLTLCCFKYIRRGFPRITAYNNEISCVWLIFKSGSRRIRVRFLRSLIFKTLVKYYNIIRNISHRIRPRHRESWLHFKTCRIIFEYYWKYRNLTGLQSSVVICFIINSSYCGLIILPVVRSVVVVHILTKFCTNLGAFWMIIITWSE